MDEDEDNVEVKKGDVENSFQKTYGWFLVINRIAGNDFTKHDQIYKKNITEALNQLSFLIDYDKEQARLQKLAASRN